MSVSLLRMLRLEKGLDVAAAAERLGVGSSSVYRWEKGACAPSLESCVRMSALYGVSVETLAERAARRSFTDYSGGDVGIYWECPECGACLLAPPGCHLCPSCGRDSLTPIDVGNGLGGLATRRSVLMCEDLPSAFDEGDPAALVRSGEHESRVRSLMDVLLFCAEQEDAAE